MYASDLTHKNAALEDKLHQLYRLNRDKTIDMGFRPPYLELLKALGNPHKKLPPVIHVAGTNGKGSTIAMMRAMLEAAGYSVHSYTSPHLMEFNERITLAGQNISNEFLEELVDEALLANNGRETTFFEITTSLAFMAFSRVPADIVLLEVGLGGRLDCTNIIDTAALSVINTISYDHMEFLGETLPEIAAEKTGIMKRQTPCAIGAQETQTWPTFQSVADSNDVTLFRNGSDWSISEHKDHICFESGAQSHIYPKPHLTGSHQVQNAGLAIAAIKTLCAQSHFKVTDESIAQGLKNVKWPARLEKLELQNSDWELWLDGGHNADAGKAISHQAKRWHENAPKKLHLILAMMSHKDPNTFLSPLLPHLASISVINIPGEPDSMSAENLIANIGEKAGACEITQADSAQSAIDNITATNTDAGRILIAGSLYLAGHILKERRNKAHNKT